MEEVVQLDSGSFSDSQKYFARVSDTVFWDDKERVQVLIDLAFLPCIDPAFGLKFWLFGLHI